MANNKDFILNNAVEINGRSSSSVGDDNTSGTQGYYLSGGSYTQMFVVSSQTTVPVAVAFKTDGTIMYVLEQSTDSVFQYTLSTAWDVSTATYASKSFSVQTQDTVPRSFTFKPDGTKMYMAGNNDTVYQYGLSTAWDISTASYDSVSASVSAQATDPQGLVFKSDGTRMYVTDNAGRDIEEYTLSTAWDLSTLSHSYTLDVSNEDTIPFGLAISSDGTEVLYAGAANDTIFKYTLTTAWDLSTASYSGESLYVGLDPAGIFFSSDGSRMYLAEYSTNDAIYEYSTGLATADFDISTGNYFTDTVSENVTYTFSNVGDVQTFQLEVTGGGEGYSLSGASYDFETFSVISQETLPEAIAFKPDGTKMFIAGRTGDDVNEYTLSTAFDVTTASFVDSYSVATNEVNVTGLFFSTDGTKFYVVGTSNDTVYQYNLTTAWDVSTAGYFTFFSVNSQSTSPQGISFKSDGTKMYVMDVTNNTIWQYSLSTAWGVNTASYDSKSFNVGTQAATGSDLAFNDTGTRLIVLDRGTRDLYQYTLSTAWDVSTASYDSVSFPHTDQTTDPSGVAFADSGKKMYVVDYNTDLVYQYSSVSNYAITWPSSIEWEGGTAPATTEDGQKDIFTFTTDDGGTSYVGVKSVENLS